MPQNLKTSATCPRCQQPLNASTRTVTASGSAYEYLHAGTRACFEFVPLRLVEKYEREVYYPLHENQENG
jgi:hypothetical protein